MLKLSPHCCSPCFPLLACLLLHSFLFLFSSVLLLQILLLLNSVTMQFIAYNALLHITGWVCKFPGFCEIRKISCCWSWAGKVVVFSVIALIFSLFAKKKGNSMRTILYLISVSFLWVLDLNSILVMSILTI